MLARLPDQQLQDLGQPPAGRSALDPVIIVERLVRAADGELLVDD